MSDKNSEYRDSGATVFSKFEPPKSRRDTYGPPLSEYIVIVIAAPMLGGTRLLSVSTQSKCAECNHNFQIRKTKRYRHKNSKYLDCEDIIRIIQAIEIKST